VLAITIDQVVHVALVLCHVGDGDRTNGWIEGVIARSMTYAGCPDDGVRFDHA
jgi:hypothetical protein